METFVGSLEISPHPVSGDLLPPISLVWLFNSLQPHCKLLSQSLGSPPAHLYSSVLGSGCCPGGPYCTEPNTAPDVWFTVWSVGDTLEECQLSPVQLGFPWLIHQPTSMSSDFSGRSHKQGHSAFHIVSLLLSRWSYGGCFLGQKGEV